MDENAPMRRRPSGQPPALQKLPVVNEYHFRLSQIRQVPRNLSGACADAAIAAAGAKSMYTVFASDPISARFYAVAKGIKAEASQQVGLRSFKL